MFFLTFSEKLEKFKIVGSTFLTIIDTIEKLYKAIKLVG